MDIKPDHCVLLKQNIKESNLNSLSTICPENELNLFEDIILSGPQKKNSELEELDSISLLEVGSVCLQDSKQPDFNATILIDQQTQLKKVKVQSEVFTFLTIKQLLDEKPKKNCCNCSKNNCLRLHCVCFKRLGYCTSECGCKSCLNLEEYQKARDFVIQKTKMINSKAFVKKTLEVKEGIFVSQTGCKCKTNCSKKYCECRRLGAKCSPICRCNSCINDKVELDREQI